MEKRCLVRMAQGKSLIDVADNCVVRHIDSNCSTRKFARKRSKDEHAKHHKLQCNIEKQDLDPRYPYLVTRD
jgi:hypothetical protein